MEVIDILKLRNDYAEIREKSTLPERNKVLMHILGMFPKHDIVEVAGFLQVPSYEVSIAQHSFLKGKLRRNSIKWEKYGE